MAVATAAPITAMVENVPTASGFGNGSHAPVIGYATMAKHITATGAFCGFPRSDGAPSRSARPSTGQRRTDAGLLLCSGRPAREVVMCDLAVKRGAAHAQFTGGFGHR